MITDAEKVLNDLKSKKYAPVYFLQGDEPFYIDSISNHVENEILNESEKEFNQTVVYGKDVNMNDILTHARRFPMMSEKQIVIVKEAQEIQDLNKESGQKILEEYVKNPQPSTILVFCYKYKTLDRRKTLTKTIDKHAVLVQTKKLYENQVPKWITDHVASRGLKINNKAVILLAQNIGNNLERLSNEINKITLNLNGKKEITEDLIQRYVGISKDFNVFELQNALISNDIGKANQIAQHFALNPKSNPLVLTIGALFSFFSKLLVVHQSKDKSERALASALKINPFFAKDYIQGARSYPPKKVLDNLQYIAEADLSSKGINKPSVHEGEILKELIFKLMH